ncbi:hypothetical protein PCH_Pc22g24090 [Penicillium rubens Wisconsin 54-1255]|uniref:Uncharacterized protein n=1 Tax=Penicillium rubens (strain ATCC 28089 / DSM 1075 / NRRL 1951 / Wisconsin 54-1255) TaxID=500485 RepID=B6HQ56_PENRW|nr:hypothetical protein PCH_Pc22g24090 [Penicillium rubens Wisconsin 54-1255]
MTGLGVWISCWRHYSGIASQEAIHAMGIDLAGHDQTLAQPSPLPWCGQSTEYEIVGEWIPRDHIILSHPSTDHGGMEYVYGVCTPYSVLRPIQFLRLCAGIWLHSDMAHEFSAGRFLGYPDRYDCSRDIDSSGGSMWSRSTDALRTGVKGVYINRSGASITPYGVFRTPQKYGTPDMVSSHRSVTDARGPTADPTRGLYRGGKSYPPVIAVDHPSFSVGYTYVAGSDAACYTANTLMTIYGVEMKCLSLIFGGWKGIRLSGYRILKE